MEQSEVALETGVTSDVLDDKVPHISEATPNHDPIEEPPTAVESLELRPTISTENPAQSNIESSPNVPRKTDVIPSDIKELTIRNLDTGEEFIIGQDDPDFDFDTFELRGDLEQGAGSSEVTVGIPRRQSYWQRFVTLFFKGSVSDPKSQVQISSDSTVIDAAQSNSSSTFKTPFTKLSSFKFRRELGKGAFGRVLLAEARVDGKLYALKIISKKNMRSSDKRQAKAERDILHAMGHRAPHPFTAGLKFAFQSENNLYLGMDYFPGGTLRELIKRFGCLPEDWVRFYSAELVLAISHLHSLHVLYRDIKPHNVMLDARGHIILIDFGLSKQEIMHPRGAMSLVGTPDYSAPEVLRTGVFQIEQYNKQKAGGDKAKHKKTDAPVKTPANIGYGKAADWWSIGVMIFEMLGGMPAFRGADLRETYQKVLFADLIFKPEDKFSEDAKALISGLLRREPSLRLGAWDNPPTDIMRMSFFSKVQWEDIYYRKMDGPWIPEPVVFRNQSFSVSQDPKVCGSQAKGDEFRGFSQAIGPISVAESPALKKSFASSPVAIKSVAKPVSAAVRVPQTPMVQSAAIVADKKAQELQDDILAAGQMDEDIDIHCAPQENGNGSSEVLDKDEPVVGMDSDTELPDEPEIVPLRDSIFISGKGKSAANVVQDWSFVDMEALAAAVEDGPLGENNSSSRAAVAQTVTTTKLPFAASPSNA